MAFEILEAVRYLPYLHRDSAVVVNTQKILPPAVALGKAKYPDNILDELKSRHINVVAIDAFAVAESVGELRTANVAMVGAMSNFVITSYSIHYTKLYESRRCSAVRANCSISWRRNNFV